MVDRLIKYSPEWSQRILPVVKEADAVPVPRGIHLHKHTYKTFLSTSFFKYIKKTTNVEKKT